MITLQKYTPEVYYRQSRDFQYLGRLYDILFNAVKTRADQLYNLPITDDMDEKLVDLAAMSLGFKIKHNYNVQQLKAICSVFSEILRKKGSMQAIELACRTLLRAEGITEAFSYEIYNNTLTIYISRALSDASLLYDLLDYVLPAGMTCEIVRALNITADTSKTALATNDAVRHYKVTNSGLLPQSSRSFSQYQDNCKSPLFVDNTIWHAPTSANQQDQQNTSEEQ